MFCGIRQSTEKGEKIDASQRRFSCVVLTIVFSTFSRALAQRGITRRAKVLRLHSWFSFLFVPPRLIQPTKFPPEAGEEKRSQEER